jgi:Tfp pilus assembly protein PilF
MIPKDDRHPIQNGLSAFMLLGLFILLIYSNSFHAAWHLDDYNSIIGNQLIHAEPTDPGSVLDPIFSLSGDGPTSRLFAFFTFALNWYFGQDNPAGYHLANLLIHIGSAFVLFCTLTAIFQTPRLKGCLNRSQIHFISLLATVLWAINPIQVQSITYIVQRMASLCGLFYLLGIYTYIRARLNENLWYQLLFSLMCLVSFLLAMATKENAATFPLALLTVEATFFHDFSRNAIRRKGLWVALAAASITLAAIVWLFLKIDLAEIISSYDKRYFTMTERLLTQPRVLLFYLSLIFYPSPARLSLVHDFDVSSSLLDPWTTLASILVVFGLVGFSLFKLRRWPIISFPVLFFFLAHLVESSFIPLELVFEHRNYLPSMFLFLPIAFGLHQLLVRYRNKNLFVFRVLLAFIPLLLVGLGVSTYIRNIVWATEKSLWEDAMRKAPRSARPYSNLAWAHYERSGDKKSALVLYHEALAKRHDRKSQHAKIYNNIANIYYLSGNCRQAGEYWRKSKGISESFYMPRYRLAMALTRCGQIDEALLEIEKALELAPEFIDAIQLKGVIRLLQNQPADALVQFRACVRMEPDESSHFINIGATFVIMGEHQRAELFLEQALRSSGRDRLALLWSALNYMRMNNGQKADKALDELADRLSLAEMALWLNMGFEARVYRSDIIFPPVDNELIRRLTDRYERRLPLLEKVSGR